MTINNNNNRPQVHDAKRCPECDTLGILAELRTQDRERDWDRTKSRVYKCPECSTRWEMYV